MEYRKWLDRFYTENEDKEWLTLCETLGPDLLHIVESMCGLHTHQVKEQDLGDGVVVVNETTRIDFPCRYVIMGDAVIAVPVAQRKLSFSRKGNSLHPLRGVKDVALWKGGSESVRGRF